MVKFLRKSQFSSAVPILARSARGVNSNAPLNSARSEIENQVLRVLRDIFSWGGGEYSFDTLRVEAGVTPDFAIPHCRRVDALLQGVGKPA